MSENRSVDLLVGNFGASSRVLHTSFWQCPSLHRLVLGASGFHWRQTPHNASLGCRKRECNKWWFNFKSRTSSLRRGKKRPGANRTPEFVPRKSPPKRGLWESYFLQGIIGKTHTQNLQILREDTLGPLARPAPFVCFRLMGLSLVAGRSRNRTGTRKPKPSEPFSQEPKAEPEPPEPFSRNRNRNRPLSFKLS